MKNDKKCLLPIALGCICASFLFPSCNGSRQNASGQTDSLCLDTVVYLQEGSEVPSCSLSLKYTYLTPASDEDTLTALINRRIRTAGFGKEYADMPPAHFVKALADHYLKDYRSDVEPLYHEDKARGLSPDEAPAWYNYTYDFQTSLKKGTDRIWNYGILTFAYTGGAHPNTVRQWFNIDAATGHLYTKEEVFDMDHAAAICDLILKELIAEANRRLETDTITSAEGLQENGMLLNFGGGLFVPDNFFIHEDHIAFCYNRYDIAPYSAGDFVLCVPKEQIAPYLKPLN